MARMSNRTRKPSQSRRLGARNTAAKVRTIPCVARASQARARDTQCAPARKTPRITISGVWLRAAGFAPGKPCLVRAFAYRQLIVYQPD